MMACTVALVLLAFICLADCHRNLLDSSPEPWPPEWDVPVKLMSKGDLLARGGAMRALGKEKIKAIKDRAAVQTSIEALANTLDLDDDLMVDVANDRLLFNCRGLLVQDKGRTGNISSTVSAEYSEPAQGESSVSTATAPPVLTYDEVFSLSSRPGAPRIILLDFDGHNVTDTFWNSEARPSILAQPYDTDGDPNSFSAAELADMKAVWRSVAEDYALFDVDVTTKDPGSDALFGKGIRVIIGGSSKEWYGTAGGSAWVGSFGSKNPAFVWPQQLGPFNPKYVAESAAHEAGHSMGLLHDGVGSETYFAGHGDYAPIMGMSYMKPITQWDKGEYANSNNKQDDIAVLSNFLTVLPQQYGSSISSATPLPAGGQVSGIISKAGQTDYFSFTAVAGFASVCAYGAGSFGKAVSIGNLDMGLVLYDALGNSIQSSNQTGATSEGLGASVVTNLTAPGTYYVSITGVGMGDPKINGYSSYGSLGQYTLSVSQSGDGSCFNPNDGPVDCVGEWSRWAECSRPCGGGNRTSTFEVSTPAKNGGLACVLAAGTTKTQACNKQACSAAASPTPSSLTLRIANIQMQRIGSNNQYKCRAIVTIQSSTGAKLAKARVMARWSARNAAGTASEQAVNMLTSSRGAVVSTSQVVTGKSCTFTVKDVILAGYRWSKDIESNFLSW